LSNDPIASGNSAACAGPIDVDYYGLAIVQNNGGAINWIRPSGQAALGQDPANPNLFVGPMASVYAGYDLTVAVVFLGPQNLSVTHFMKEQGNPDCRHFFEYSAFRLN
jgi:hypothetical protein